MDNVQKINIQPPDWVGDAIAFVVLLSINALLRSVKSHIWKHMPVWIWSFITWVVMTVLFIDLNIIRKVLKKVLPFVDHFLSGISLTDKWLLVPLPLKLLLWALLSLGLGWQAWTSTKDGPLGKKQRAHALRMVDGLYNTGYLMQDECVLLKHILNEPLLFKEAVALKLLSCLRTILIKGETADACVPCRALVQVVRSTGNGEKGGTGDEWPAPLTTGPLQELGDVELKQMHEAVRVWLRATQRDGRAKYAALKEINVEIIHHFSRQCHTAKRKLVKQDVDMMVNSLLVKRLKEHIGPAGLKFNQYKMLWQWYCTVVAMVRPRCWLLAPCACSHTPFFCSWFSQINSDATVQKAWDERWVAGFVDRRESEEMLKQSGAGSVL